MSNSFLSTNVVSLLVVFYSVCTFVLLPIQATYAHNPNEAFFIVSQKGGTTIEVEAELPWTIRDALLKYNPELAQAQHKKEFEATFFSYIQTHLQLQDKTGTSLQLESIQEAPHTGHTHQTKYLLQYQGNNIATITNTIMFEEYDNQENFHTIFTANKKWTYSTTVGAATFNIGAVENQTKNNYFWLLGIGLVVLVGLVFKRFRTK